MNDHKVAIHEAGHATVLASLGRADELWYTTATRHFQPPYIADLEKTIKELGGEVPKYEDDAAGKTSRWPDSAPLPLAIAVPYALGGAVANRRDDPEQAFDKMKWGCLGGDVEQLVRGLKAAGQEVSDNDVVREVNRLLFERRDSRLPAVSATTKGQSQAFETLHGAGFAALSGGAVSPNPRHACLEVGYNLATEKIATHWNVVRELADRLLEVEVLYSDDLLAFFERHGLSSA
jgi:hypothetical protein